MSIHNLLGIFKKKKAPMPRTNPAEFIAFGRATPEYRHLVNITNTESADFTLLTIYEKFSKVLWTQGSTLTDAMFDPNQFASSLANYLTIEANTVQNAILDIDGLMVECLANIGQSLRTRPEYQMSEGDYGALPTDSDMLKAAKYITNASNSITNTLARENQVFVVGEMEKVLNRNLDLRSIDTLYDINTMFFQPNFNQLYRMPNREARYPGVGGGYYLHEYSSRQSLLIQEESTHHFMTPMFTQRSGTQVPVAQGLTMQAPYRRYGNYTNIACFLFGSYLRAHGFTDGNGRTVRFLFSCAMIKSGLPFVAPSQLFEHRLTGLNPTQKELQIEQNYGR